MNQQERRRYLIEALLGEKPEYRGMKVPQAELAAACGKHAGHVVRPLGHSRRASAPWKPSCAGNI